MTRYRRPVSPREFPGQPPLMPSPPAPSSRGDAGRAGGTGTRPGRWVHHRGAGRHGALGRMGRWIRALLARSLPLGVVAVLAVAAGPAELRGQSVAAGEVLGNVTDVIGEAVGGGQATLVDRRSGFERDAEVRRGRFGFDFIPAGEYILRVEVLGYRPVVVTGVTVEAGDRVVLPVQLTPATPPVTEVDTTSWLSASIFPGGVGGRRISAGEVELSPDLHRDLVELVSLSSAADESLGFTGLPGNRTAVYAEGEPVPVVDHPHRDGSPYAGLAFPREGLASGSVTSGRDDIEWANGTGGVVRLSSRAAANTPRAGGFGLWSGDALWTSSVLDETPGLTSLWGGAHASLPLIPDTALLALSFEGSRVQEVVLPSAGDSAAARLVPDLAAALEEPLAETTLFRGVGRLDWGLDDGGHVLGRVAFATFTREREGAGSSLLGYGTRPPADGTDVSGAAVVGVPVADDYFLETRASVGLSDREYGAEDALPGAWLVAERAWLGSDPTLAGSLSRLDASVAPTLHYRSGPHQVKGGIRVDYTDYEYTYAEHSGGLFLFGSEAAAQGQDTWFVRFPGTVPTVSFPVLRVAGFAQYRWNVSPGFDLTTAVRFERERLPEEVPLWDQAWERDTGLRNDEYETSYDKVGGRLNLRWDVAGDGRTWISGGIAIQNGVIDPAALAEIYTLDRNTRVQTGRGTVDGWPVLPDSAELPRWRRRHALLGPEIEAPQTTRGEMSFSTRLAPGVTAAVTAAVRRTDYLLRRVDLGLVDLPSGTDQFGRPVYGLLRTPDRLLVADLETSRRFEDFEMVWGRNADGWSEYQGVTVAVEADVGTGKLAVEYTRSETTDNLVGARGMGSLAELVPDLGIADWDEGTSDWDVPDRLTVSGILPLPLPAGGSLVGAYRYRSGLPFTPMVAPGLDANGDGSAFNDPAYIPSSGLGALAGEWDCLSRFQGGFPERNACRGDGVHRLDLRLAAGLGELGGRSFQIVVDALNVMDSEVGLRDPGLLVLDPQGELVQGPDGNVQVPWTVNPDFGTFIQRTDPGRWIRVGLRIGGGS